MPADMTLTGEAAVSSIFNQLHAGNASHSHSSRMPENLLSHSAAGELSSTRPRIPLIY